MLDNLQVACHVIDAAHRHRVRKLLYLASCCSYPKLCAQPMQVPALMTGPLEPTNEAYALAKLAGMTLCRAYAREYGAKFITGIPANLFGIEDHFTADGGHVIPALFARMHDAKEAGDSQLAIWGTGTPRREFLFADDLADACLFAMRHYEDTQTPLNLGGGTDLSIRETAEAIRDVVGYEGELVFDTTKPDGMPLKSLDSTPLLDLGWKPTLSFTDALQKTYAAFLMHRETEARDALELTHAA
jgi:GDP-L-fucose synthase